MNQIALLTPVFVLTFWTFIIFLIMAYGRARFMKDPQDAAHTKDLKGTLPAWVERTADNYNHLFEQPIAFYVVTLAIALINSIDPLIIQLAWAFVILRIKLIAIIIPSQIGSAPIAINTGPTIGTMTKLISMKSRIKPNKKIKTITKTIEPKRPPGIELNICSMSSSPPKPLKTREKTEAPIKIIKTIEVMAADCFTVSDKV